MMTCIKCGSPDVFAILPGREEERNLFLLRFARPDRAWCKICWPCNVPERKEPGNECPRPSHQTDLTQR
jgi:hypothetical protein